MQLPAPRSLLALPGILTLAVIAITIVTERLLGRRYWCACGTFSPWKSDVWSSHCSQHFFDPYSVTHFSHGLIFCTILALAARRWPVPWRFFAAITAACLWEVVENSPFIINRYRSATMSLDYLGDSIANSLGDIASCALGFLAARKLGWKWSTAVFVTSELALLATIRDNLTLNVIMLVYPIEAIRVWQSVGH